jgi:chemotaxis protein MotB
MNHSGNDVPIRIVKKKTGHGGHHGGAWKVAYADFVTAMMALFIVLWIVGQSKQVKQYVANYFKDPGAFFESTKGGGMFQGANLVGKEQIVDEYLKRDQEKLKEATESILKNLGKDASISKLIDQIKIDTVEEGMRIELLEATKAYFFDVGTATLNPEATKVLSIIANEVGKLPNKVIVEGHTDSRPYSREDGYTNFELSAERANSARRILAVHGVREHQIDEVRGYADTRLRNVKDPYDVTNRRISIIIEWQDGKHHGSK